MLTKEEKSLVNQLRKAQKNQGDMAALKPVHLDEETNAFVNFFNGIWEALKFTYEGLKYVVTL